MSPMVTTYQPKGRLHIIYIQKMASAIWEQNEFKIDWAVCLAEAFRRHREYLLSYEKAKDHPIYRKRGDGRWELMTSY